MAFSAKIGGKELTSQLRKLSEQLSEDGSGNTRLEQLAALVWKFALGWTEETRDAEGNIKTTEHKPVAWAVQFLWERIEGKAPVAASEQTGGVKAVDKVRALARERINSMATASIAGGPRPVPTPGPIAPPPYRPRAGSGPTPGTRSDAERSGTQRPDGA